MQHFPARRWSKVCCLVFATMVCASPAAQNGLVGLHAIMPAGYDLVQLKPAGIMMSLMGLIECPEVEGVQQVSQGLNARVVSAHGSPISNFPKKFSFRVTASLRNPIVNSLAVSTLDTSEDARDLLLKLKFRVRGYNALKVREISPESIEMIGMPAEISYDERVYRITVTTENLPVTERLELEVLSPHGERLTHFYFGLL